MLIKKRKRMRRRRRAGEERGQATGFEGAVCCPVVVQRAGQQNIKGSARGNWDPRESQQPF